MSRNVKILALTVLTCANLALLIYLGFRQSAPSTPPAAAGNEIDKLPPVEIIDDTGKRIALGELPGRVLPVQFVNPNK